MEYNFRSKKKQSHLEYLVTKIDLNRYLLLYFRTIYLVRTEFLAFFTPIWYATSLWYAI